MNSLIPSGEDTRPKTTKSKVIAMIFVPWSANTSNRAEDIGDYINCVVCGIMLSYSRAFDEIHLCTASSITKVYQVYLKGKDLQFEFRGKKYKYPMKEIMKDELLQSSRSRSESVVNKGEKKSFFLKMLRSLKTDANTTLFLFLLDHGEEETVGKLRYSAIIKQLDQMTLGHAVVISDAFKSGNMVEYIRLSQYINDNNLNSDRIVAAGKVYNLAKRSVVNAAFLCDVINTLNTTNFINSIAYDKGRRIKYVCDLSAIFRGSFSLLKTRFHFDQFEKNPQLKDVPFLIAYESLGINRDPELVKEVDGLDSISCHSYSKLADNLSFLEYLGFSDFEYNSNALRGLIDYMNLWIKEKKKLYCEKESIQKAREYLDKFKNVYFKNVDFKTQTDYNEQYSCRSSGVYSLLEDHLPSPKFKITAISSTSANAIAHFSHLSMKGKTKFYLGSPGTIEFIAAICLDNGTLRSVYDQYYSNILSLDLNSSEGKQIPSIFSNDPWFDITNLEDIIPRKAILKLPESDPFENRFVSMVNEAGFQRNISTTTKLKRRKFHKNISQMDENGEQKDNGEEEEEYEEYEEEEEEEEEDDEEDEEEEEEEEEERDKEKEHPDPALYSEAKSSQSDLQLNLKSKRSRKDSYQLRYKDRILNGSLDVPYEERGRYIVKEFVNYLNWKLEKRGIRELYPYNQSIESREESELYDEYLGFEEGYDSLVLDLPYFWSVRKGFAKLLPMFSTKDLDLYDIYGEALDSFDKIIRKNYMKVYRKSRHY